MDLDRRSALGGLGLALAAPALPALAAPAGAALPPPPPPIGRDERERRIEAARRRMRALGLDGFLVEPGAAMIYFTGVEWWRSERITAAFLPLDGTPIIITPFFEAPSIRETLGVPAEIAVWQEDEWPLAILAAALRRRGIAGGRIGIEDTVRVFVAKALAEQGYEPVPGAPVARDLRLAKSPAELALMAHANRITLAAMRHAWETTREGMTRADLAALITAATARLGGAEPDALVLVGEASAYPHGSRAPQIVREGSVVLMDCGCSVGGYKSDISRTFVFGRPSDAVRLVWDTVAEGRRMAMRAARPGARCGSVDDAVRAFYEAKGYGPGYKLPGLPHRTGHGIGLDGHEPSYLVHGDATPLAPGMCFSNEPGLYLPGQFGVRLEDCFHMTPAGPVWFTEPPPSIDQPFG